MIQKKKSKFLIINTFGLIKETLISESNYERLKKALGKQFNNLRDSDANMYLHLTL